VNDSVASTAESVVIEAGDPSTPSSRLHVLARSRRREVRAAVAANPNVSLADLDVLCRRFADEVGSNPVLDWLTLTDTDWLNELAEASRHRLLSSSSCPPGLLWWTLHGGDDDDVLAALGNRSLPSGIRQRATLHEEPTIVEAALLHVSWVADAESARLSLDDDVVATIASAFARVGDEPELGDLLAADLVPKALITVIGLPDDGDARRELARRCDTPAATLCLLLGDDDAATRRYARRNPSTDRRDRERWDRLEVAREDLSVEDLRVLSAGSFGRERCAGHPVLPTEVLRSCVVDGSWRVREAAATNPSVTLEQIAVLANDPDRDVRAAAARNVALPDDAVVALTLDTDTRVADAATQRLRSLVDRPVVGDVDLLRGSLPDDALVRLRRRTAAMTADLTRCSPAVLATMVADEDTLIRTALASNPTTPTAVLGELSGDHDVVVRRRVAVTTRDPELLAKLAGDPNAEVQVSVATNPALPEFVALRLADTANDDVRAALLLRPGRGPALMAKLFRDDEDRRAFDLVVATTVPGAASPRLDGETLDLVRGALDRQPWVALVLAQYPSSSSSLLEVLRTSPNWRVRQAVASHPNCSVEVLVALAGDADNDVRSAVAVHPLLRPEHVAAFFTETDEKVRRALVSRSDLGAELLTVHVLGDDGLRDLALSHPSMAPETRDELRALRIGRPVAEETLARFLNTSARALVVSHPDATAEQLRIAASDPAWTIREAVAEHQHCSAVDLEALALDQDRDVRAAVAANSRTPVTTVSDLIGDADPRVRRAAATHPKAGLDRDGEIAASRRRSLGVALRSARGAIRVVALLDAAVSASELARPRHAHSIEWIERFAVAQHRHVPPEVRERLANDANRLVAAAARGDIRWP
jgi:hypothetical protein